MVFYCNLQDLSVTGYFGNINTSLLEKVWHRVDTLWGRLGVNITKGILTYIILILLKSNRIGEVDAVR